MLNAKHLNLVELTIVAHASAASLKWTTIAPGSIIVSALVTINFSCYLYYGDASQLFTYFPTHSLTHHNRIFVISVYSLCLICTKFSVCYLHNEACEGNILSLLLLLFEAIIFGLFTLCMMGDQASVILTNQTQIDRY